jgi:hypothetical protein
VPGECLDNLIIRDEHYLLSVAREFVGLLQPGLTHRTLGLQTPKADESHLAVVAAHCPGCLAVSPAAGGGGGFGLVTLPNGVMYAVGGWNGGTLLAATDAAALIAPKTLIS